ncbi:MAG: WD40/YVTN/BNR-like repeat-containing protein, partial [Vicinamibacterales bacterium]
MRHILTACFTLVLVSTSAHAQGGRGGFAGPADGGPNGLGWLHFRALGPEGNRVASIAGVPGDPMTVYVGAADGGVWKTTDAGIRWEPIFDKEDVSAIGALAVAPSAHDTVWAGTGEPWMIRPYYTLGDGVYKSADAGRTWQHMGLDATGRIARIVIDPANADNVYVCAIGQAHRQQKERGVFHTTDGGATWKQVLAVDENTGCSDLAMDPRDAKTLYAGMWQLIIHRDNLNSGGPGSGVYITRDGGATWNKITGHGLPAADHALGKIAVAVAPNNPSRVYALVQDAPAPGLYRSNDRGETWQLVNQSHMPAERAPYYTRLAVSPDDENLLYFPSVGFTMSRDGGTTVFQPGRGGGAGAAAAGGRGR